MRNKIIDIQDKIRDKFKTQRIQKCSPSQNLLYNILKSKYNTEDFKITTEKEIYTKHGVRFLDIFIEPINLSIEVDGKYHENYRQKLLDMIRERELWNRKKIITIRFTNDEVLNNINNVILRLLPIINKLKDLCQSYSVIYTQEKMKYTLARKKIYRKINNSFGITNLKKLKNIAIKYGIK